MSKRAVESNYAKVLRNKGFGLALVKQEGTPAHPDTFGFTGTDEAYLKRLQAYADYHGVAATLKTFLSRPELADRLTENKP